MHAIEQFENLNSIIFFQRARQLKTKRDEASDSYKAGRFQEAFDLYSTALSIDPSNKTILAKLYCSRATVLAKVSSTKYRPGQANLLFSLCPSLGILMILNTFKCEIFSKKKKNLKPQK